MRVHLIFDWINAPEVSEPPLMSVWFYPEDQSIVPFYATLPGDTGGYIDVPAGRYTLVSHPSESEINRTTSGAYHHEHSLHTRIETPKTLLFSAQSAPTDLILEPETTWVASAKEVDIQETGVSYMCVRFVDGMEQNMEPRESEEQEIVLYPSDPMCYYSLEVRNLKFDVRPSALSGSLQGLSSGLYPSTLERHPTNASEGFECWFDPDGTIRAEFITFGYYRPSTTPHLLQLFLKSPDSKLYTLNIKSSPKFNLTEQVRTAPDYHHIHLIIDFENAGVELQPEQQGQFSADADEYIDIDQEIKV